MATFTLLVSSGEPYWLRVETPATNERDLVKFIMNAWSKQQCNLNFLEAFLTEHNPDALSRIFPEGSVAASRTASVNSERSHASSTSGNSEEVDDSDEDKEGPVDDDEEDDQDEDTIMRPAKVYELTSTQRGMFVNEIPQACQPVRARRSFFEMCRQNYPSIVIIKPDGLL